MGPGWALRQGPTWDWDEPRRGARSRRRAGVGGVRSAGFRSSNYRGGLRSRHWSCALRRPPSGEKVVRRGQPVVDGAPDAAGAFGPSRPSRVPCRACRRGSHGASSEPSARWCPRRRRPSRPSRRRAWPARAGDPDGRARSDVDRQRRPSRRLIVRVSRDRGHGARNARQEDRTEPRSGCRRRPGRRSRGSSSRPDIGAGAVGLVQVVGRRPGRLDGL